MSDKQPLYSLHLFMYVFIINWTQKKPPKRDILKWKYDCTNQSEKVTSLFHQQLLLGLLYLNTFTGLNSTDFTAVKSGSWVFIQVNWKQKQYRTKNWCYHLEQLPVNLNHTVVAMLRYYRKRSLKKTLYVKVIIGHNLGFWRTVQY